MTKRALFIGLTTVDIQYFIDKLPNSNEKIRTDPPHVYVGGPAANAAITFSFLGGKVDFLSCIGVNPFTDFIFNDFKKQNLNVIDFKKQISFSPVISSIMTTVENSDRSIISHLPANIDVIEDELNKICLDNYNLLFTDGFYPEFAISLCKKARAAGIPVVFDGGSWKPRVGEILRHVDFAICSDNFFPPDCSDSIEVIDYLRNIGIENIAITRGKKSIYYSEGKKIKDIEIASVEAKDSLGAGDIFHGAFVWYWLIERNFEIALGKASKIASFSTCFKGTRSWMKALADK
jgi:sugar/nucleoside kinase (ribokinase family)